MVGDGEAAFLEGVAEVAHGCQEHCDARLRGPDVFGFLGEFGHEDDVGGGVEFVESGGAGV
jgi:hypothetical protein